MQITVESLKTLAAVCEVFVAIDVSSQFQYMTRFIIDLQSRLGTERTRVFKCSLHS